MATKLTRYILFALLLGIIAGWATNAAIDDGTPASAEQLKAIAEYLLWRVVGNNAYTSAIPLSFRPFSIGVIGFQWWRTGC